MPKKSFILYNDSYESIKILSIEQKGALMDAIFQYSIDGHVPQLDQVTNMAFSFIRNYMDRDNIKWEERAKRSRINGASGGRPKKSQEENSEDGCVFNPAGKTVEDGECLTQQVSQKPSGLSENEYSDSTDSVKPSGLKAFNPEKPRKPVNVNVNVNVNGNKNIKKKKKNTTHPLYGPVKEIFLSQNSYGFSNYAKEAMHINQLIKKAERMSPEDPRAFLQNTIETYFKLTQKGNNFWRSQPFLPSALNSSGLFDRVLVEIEKGLPKKIDDDVLLFMDNTQEVKTKHLLQGV